MSDARRAADRCTLRLVAVGALLCGGLGFVLVGTERPEAVGAALTTGAALGAVLSMLFCPPRPAGDGGGGAADHHGDGDGDGGGGDGGGE